LCRFPRNISSIVHSSKVTLLTEKILNQLAKIQRFSRIEKARLKGVQLGSHPVLGSHLDFQLGIRDGKAGRIIIGDHAWIEHGAVLCAFGGSIEIDRRVFIGPHAVVYGQGGVTIGEETLIAMHCCILSSEHAIPTRKGIIRHHPDTLLPTRIGRDVWLGAGVKVLGGVDIGDGCVVGAGAVVTRNLPQHSIAVGVPARIVATRE
jgi:acetyltransferase-like isoleucine patch superfamily enzyme